MKMSAGGMATAMWGFCFIYTFAYLPENFDKRAPWVLPEGVFKSPTMDGAGMSLADRTTFAVILATTITVTSFTGILLHLVSSKHLWNGERKQEAEERAAAKEKDIRRSRSGSVDSSTSFIESLAVLIEYAIPIAVAATFCGSIYLWCMYAFESQEGFTFSIAAKFFVTSSPLAATKFARMSAGFYTSVLFLSFLDPLGARAAFGIPVTTTTSKKHPVLILLAAVGGFGGFAGVGGVGFFIALDFIEIASLLLEPVLPHLPALSLVLVSSVTSTCTFYLLVCGFFEYYWYIRQRETPEDWKCQPRRWLSDADQQHEILSGTCNMMMAGTILGSAAYWVYIGGTCALYFNPLDYGAWYLPVSTVAFFFYTDAMAYYVHRVLHTRFVYKRIHKWHHRYKAPTAFSVAAMHPLEFLVFQAILVSPILWFPMHVSVYLGIMSYLYFYGLCDHSGVHLTALWPWQPSSMFHDDHHKYFHCNFGQNLAIWDKFHDTFRKGDRQYGESVFGGRGVTKPSLQKAQ